MKTEKFLVVLLVVLLIASVFQTMFLVIKINSVLPGKTLHSGKATASAQFCINNPPVFNISCDFTVDQGETLTCQLNATDADGGALVFSSEFLTNLTLFNVSSSGLINYEPGNQSEVGNHTVQFTVSDLSGCANGADTNISIIEVTDINEPPYLAKPLPNKALALDTTITAFYLNDYWVDPEGDAITHTSSITSKLSVQILGSGEVLVTANECGDEYVVFTATDEHGLSASSPPVLFSVICEQETSIGGGGGGVSYSCEEDWKCSDWGVCYPNGTQKRRCYDQNGCADPYERFFWQECEYIAHCADGLLNYDEEGVDCGGEDCPACPTCFDGIQNQGETGIDCGGPNCEPCSHCTNGVQDEDEEGVDCGGAECEACPTCFDGIQNQGETGIDCGGPCKSCSEVQVPKPTEGARFPTTLLVIFILILSTILVVYKYYHQQINAVIKRIGWWLTRKKRKQVLLTKEEEKEFLPRVVELRKKSERVSSQESIDELGQKIGSLGKEVISAALDLKLVYSHEEFYKAIKKKDVREDLSKLLEKMAEKYGKMEFGVSGLGSEGLECSCEELISVIIQVSPSGGAGFELDFREKDLTGLQEGNVKRVLYTIVNAHKALMADKLEAGKKKYLEAQEGYYKLNEKDKGEAYDSLVILYLLTKHMISYINA